MAANGGHMYFSVHMQECAACRAEHERRLKAEHDMNVTMACILIPLGIVLIAWFHDQSHRPWLWLPWMKKRRLELEAEDRKWASYGIYR